MSSRLHCVGCLLITNGLPVRGSLTRGAGFSYFNFQALLFAEGDQLEEIAATISQSLTPRTLFRTHEGGSISDEFSIRH